MVGVILQIDRMPMLRERNAEYEVNNFAAALLPLLDSFGRMRMRGESFRIGGCVRLREDSAAIGERITNGCPELPEYLSQSLLEVFVYADVLIGAEIFVR